jgi:hypothetical protein
LVEGVKITKVITIVGRRNLMGVKDSPITEIPKANYVFPS